MSINKKVTQTFNSTNPNVATVTSTRTALATTLACDNLAGWPEDTVHFSTYQIDSSDQVIDGTQIDWKGIVSGNSIGSLERQAGAADTGNDIGDIVEMNPTASWAQDLYDGFAEEHDPEDGTHTNITATTVTTTGDITSGGTITADEFIIAGAGGSLGWETGLPAPNTITYNGNRSYDLVFNATDLTDTLSPGMRLRTTRTVTAPTQCTDLESGSSQYWSKSSPTGITFTDDFTVMAWVKLESYGRTSILSRVNGTQGWEFGLEATGQVFLTGYNGSLANFKQILSYQSVPLNRWIHVAVSLDMSGASGVVYLDGVSVSAVLGNGGTNPTALVQAGDLEVGARNGATGPLDGKVAQVGLFNAVLSASTIRSSASQTLSGSETNCIGAWKFAGNGNDSSSNANNLTAQGSATATNGDSPFSLGADLVSGYTDGTTDFAEVVSASFSTNTTVVVRVPDGCTIPTSGGVSALAYSTQASPYGWPGISDVLAEVIVCASQSSITNEADLNGLTLTVTPPPGHRIKLSSYVITANSTADAYNAVTIKEGSTQLHIATANSRSGSLGEVLQPETPSFIPVAGSHTYKLTGTGNFTGSGSMTAVGSSNAPMWFRAELA